LLGTNYFCILCHDTTMLLVLTFRNQKWSTFQMTHLIYKQGNKSTFLKPDKLDKHSCTTWEFVDFCLRRLKVVATKLFPKWLGFLYLVCIMRCIGKEYILQDVCVYKKQCLYLHRHISIVNIAGVLLYLWIYYRRINLSLVSRFT